MTDQSFQKTWWPTRKWYVGFVTSVAALASNVLQADHWSRDFSVAVVTVIAGSVTSYLVPNSDYPGGYEVKPSAQPGPSLSSTSNAVTSLAS